MKWATFAHLGNKGEFFFFVEQNYLYIAKVTLYLTGAYVVLLFNLFYKVLITFLCNYTFYFTLQIFTLFMHVILYSSIPLFNLYFLYFLFFYLIWYHFIDWMVEKAGRQVGYWEMLWHFPDSDSPCPWLNMLAYGLTIRPWLWPAACVKQLHLTSVCK